MNIRTLKRSNVNMRKFEIQERNLINRIDISKQSNQAEESIMDKHYIGETSNKERTWRF
jgi:hypothetical protein